MTTTSFLRRAPLTDAQSRRNFLGLVELDGITRADATALHAQMTRSAAAMQVAARVTNDLRGAATAARSGHVG